MATALDFRPGVVSGGKLEVEEYETRSKACTDAALASLQGSDEFRTWQRAKKAQQAARAAGMPPVTTVLLLLLFAAGSIGVWRATRPPADTTWEAQVVTLRRLEPALSAVPKEASAAALPTYDPAEMDVEEEEEEEAELIPPSWEADASLAAKLDAERVHADEESAELHEQVARLQQELAAAQQATARQAEQAASAAAAAAAHEQELAAALQAQQQAEAAAAAAAAERDAAVEAAEVAQRQLAEAAALAAAAQSEADEQRSSELEAARLAASAATQQAAGLEGDLQVAVQQAARLEAELLAAHQQAAELLAEQAQAALQIAGAAGEATPASGGWEACSAEALWERAQEQPWVLGAAAAAVGGSLLTVVAVTAWVAGRRARASMAASSLDRRQLAELKGALERAQDENEARVAKFKRAQAAAAEQAAHELAEEREWRAAAATLAQATAEAECKRAAGSPTRAPLAARNNTGAAAGAAPAVLPAGKADTPSAWLDLLQLRFSRAHAAAAEAGAAAKQAEKEQAWGEDKVSEMVTENELLKERLADAKASFAGAAEREAAAKERSAGVAQDLDNARQQLAAAEASALDLQQRLEAELAVVRAERDELQQQVADARAELAEREDELAALGNLEAQVDQVTEALMQTQSAKGRLERRVAELEQDAASLGLLAEKLEGDKAVLEQQLAEAREAQAELCLASQQYIAADSAIKSIHASEDTETMSSHLVQGDLRRAVEEKVAALDLLASAERRLVEQQGDSDASPSPLPVHQLLLSGRRLSGLAGGAVSGSCGGTPRSRSARMAAYLGSKLGRVAKLLAGDGEGSDLGADTPTSARSVAGPSSLSLPAGFTLGGGLGSGAATPRHISAWLDRTQHAFSSVELLLGQDLGGQDGTHHDALSARSAASHGALSLPDSARQRERAAALDTALQRSAAEVEDLLAALDATSALSASLAQQDGDHGVHSSWDATSEDGHAQAQARRAAAAAAGAAEEAVLAVRGQLAEAHQRVQAAAARMQGAAQEAEALKHEHVGLRQQVEDRQAQVDAAQERMEAALQDKQGAERGLARTEGELAAAQAELEAATQRKQASECALQEQAGGLALGDSAGLGSSGGLLEGRQGCLDEHERCTKARAACLEAKQGALLAKQGAIEVAKAAAAALAEAEEEVEAAVDRLCQLEDAIHASFSRRASAQDDLLREQSALAAVVQAAAAALEQHAAATSAADVAAVPGVGGPQPFTAEQLAALATPNSSGSGGSRRRSGGTAGMSVDAEGLEQLFEESWLGRTPAGAGAKLDRGERAASSKDEAEGEETLEGAELAAAEPAEQLLAA